MLKRSSALDIRDVVLATVSFKEQLVGRTYLQKLAYFLEKRINRELLFKPYFYGPYSEALAEATDSLVHLGFLHEAPEVFPASTVELFERKSGLRQSSRYRSR